MLEPESLESPNLLLPARAHRPVLVLPVDPSDDELLRHWTLSEADKREVLRCRGDDNRRRFALQWCALRLFGRFVPNHLAVPVRILNYLGLQRGFEMWCNVAHQSCMEGGPHDGPDRDHAQDGLGDRRY